MDGRVCISPHHHRQKERIRLPKDRKVGEMVDRGGHYLRCRVILAGQRRPLTQVHPPQAEAAGDGRTGVCGAVVDRHRDRLERL